MDEQLHYLRSLLRTKKLDALFISSYDTIRYLSNYPGFSREEREAYVFVTKKQIYLLTDTRYSEQVMMQVPHIKTIVKTAETSTKKLLEEIIKNEKITNVGFEASDITVAEYKLFKKLFKKSFSIDLRQFRQIKTPKEITAIQKACQLGDLAFTHVCKYIKSGVTEKQLAYIIENYFRLHGAEPSFRTIVAFGANAAIPHHVTSDMKLKNNQCILFDFGAVVDGYCSDMTRTAFFGKPSEEFKNAYATVLTAQQKAMSVIVKSFTTKQSTTQTGLARAADQTARQYIIDQGYPSIPHSLGHGIGIAVHESPFLSPKSKDQLAEGMVFSIEPGIYPSNKFGIRIEDLYTIQNNKLKQLTTAPKEKLRCF